MMAMVVNDSIDQNPAVQTEHCLDQPPGFLYMGVGLSSQNWGSS